MRGSSPRMTSPTVDLTLSRLRGGAVDRRRGLAEQDRTLLWSADAAHIRVDRLRLLVGALDRRPRAHRFEPALEVREVGDVLALAFVRHDPGIDRHVRDRVVAGDEGAISQALVQHAVEPVDLVAVAVHGVDARARIAREELTRLLGEIEQHGAGLKHCDRLAAAAGARSISAGMRL